MKTIEERVKEYTEQAWNTLDYEFNEDHVTFENIVESAFIAGAISERKELLRWHDPKKELPETDVEVLVMVHADGHTYDVMRYDKHGWWQKAPDGGWCAPNNAPIGWRHIHEL